MCVCVRARAGRVAFHVALRELQKKHDLLIRLLVDYYQGYEISTQGDSFELVFPTVPLATRFCMETQKRMMEDDWSEAVMALPSASFVPDPETGQAMFAGPRIRLVRVGVHLTMCMLTP